MATESARDITEILSDPNIVVEAAREALVGAIQQHKRMGVLMAIWRDGHVAWVDPEALEQREETEQ